ncbi:MAG: sigma-E factor negative regulatory protein [Steroidobacteraceae bacterium]
MTDPVNEQLSACLDGELPPAEMELLLKRMAREEALGRTASRYSLIGAALREQQGPLASVDFAARVAHAVTAEALHAAQTVAPASHFDRRRWLRPVMTGAMAAGIAMFAVLIANRPDTGTSDPVATNSPAASSFSAPTTAATPVNWPNERLTNYVVAHSEYSSPLGRPMVLNGLLTEQNPAEEPAPPQTTPSSAESPASEP